MRIGILHHPKIPDSESLAREIDNWLKRQSVNAWQGSSWGLDEIMGELEASDMIITLGGDGTLLRTARIAAPSETPVLGINMGKLGFLAEVQPEVWERRLWKLLAREYWVEKRLMLQVDSWKNGEQQASLTGLNEAVVSRGSLARVVHISTEVNDSYLTTYVADGVIVSTPTGSTAYALAAGGPILPPELRNILLLPIAAHLSLARPLVLDQGAVVTLHVRTDHTATLTVDGQFQIDLDDGDRVVLTSSPHSAHFIRIQPRSYFYRTLMERLQRRQ